MAFLKSVVSKIRKGIDRTRETFVGSLRSVLLGRRVDEALLAELEVLLIKSDVGVKTTMQLLDGIRTAWKSGDISTGDQVLVYLKREIGRAHV